MSTKSNIPTVVGDYKGGNGPSKGFTVKIGWLEYALTAAIVAIRAFQPNAEKMSDWSVLSWFFMITPILYPLYIFIAAKMLWVVLECMALACDGIAKIYSKIHR